MILSTFLTSVGINLGLCLLFFTLYSVLKKQPGMITLYSSRLLKEHRSQQIDDFRLERLLSSASWVKRILQVSDDKLLTISGLDAVVFMRIFVFSLKVFTFAVIVGVFILLPVNYLGNQLTDDFSELPKKSLGSFTISNVNNGSNRLWIHFCAAYIFTGVVCYFLYCNEAEKLYKKLTRLNSENGSEHKSTRSGFLGLFGKKVNIVNHCERALEDLEINMRAEAQTLAGKEISAAFVAFKSRLGAAVALHIQPGISPTEWDTQRAPDPRDVYWPFFC